MSKYKTIAAIVSLGSALKADAVTAYVSVKAAAKRFKVKVEIAGLEYAGKKNLDVATAMSKASEKAVEARKKNLEEAAKKAQRIVELKKKLLED